MTQYKIFVTGLSSVNATLFDNLEVSLPCSQEHRNTPCPASDESRLHFVKRFAIVLSCLDFIAVHAVYAFLIGLLT